MSLATFLWVHSNSEEVSYLSSQNTYPNLKNLCHIKLNFFLWTKLLENLLLAKYLISVAASSMLRNCFKNHFWKLEKCFDKYLRKGRSSRRRCSVKKGVLRDFAKLTRKHLCQSIRPATLLKKRLLHRYFPVNFAKFLRTPFFIERLWWLLLEGAGMDLWETPEVMWFPNHWKYCWYYKTG